MKKLTILMTLVFSLFMAMNLMASENKKQFNSLAEEVAYEKQKQNEEIENQNKANEGLDSILDEFRNERINFFKKFLVGNEDSLESIDEKYKNSAQIMTETNKEYIRLRNKAVELTNKYKNNKNLFDFSVIAYTPVFIQFRMFTNNLPSGLLNKYFQYNGFNPNSIDIHQKFNQKDYQIYLKKAYEDYDFRVTLPKQGQERIESFKVEIAKNIEEKQQKLDQDNKVRLEKANMERAKVKKDCDKWLEKSKQEVYSLGVGEYVVKMSNGQAVATYQIKSVQKNTFLLNDYILGEFYDQISSYIPRTSIDSAPSVYCYK